MIEKVRKYREWIISFREKDKRGGGRKDSGLLILSHESALFKTSRHLRETIKINIDASTKKRGARWQDNRNASA